MLKRKLESDPGEDRKNDQDRLNNLGDRMGQEYLDQLAKTNGFKNGLIELLDEPGERMNINQQYDNVKRIRKSVHYKPFISTAKQFLATADSSSFFDLLQCSPILRSAANVPQYYQWWNGRSVDKVIDDVYNSEQELMDNPAYAMFVLHLIRNKMAHFPVRKKIKLSENKFVTWSEAVKKAIRVLGVAIYGSPRGENEANMLIREVLHILDGKTPPNQDELRMLKLHRLIQNAGVPLGRKFLDKRAEYSKNRNGLVGLISKKNEQQSIKVELQELIKNGDNGTPAIMTEEDFIKKPNFLDKADIIVLKYLMQCSPTLKSAVQIPAEHKEWWNRRNTANVIDNVYNSNSALTNKPGSAILVLYHIQNELIRSLKAYNFSLRVEPFQILSETTKRAIRVLGVEVHGATKGESIATDLSKKALNIDNGVTLKEFRATMHDFYTDSINESDVIKKVLNDSYVEEQFMNSNITNSIAKHLVTKFELIIDQFEPPSSYVSNESNQMKALLNSFRMNLKTYEKLNSFCEELKKLQPPSFANVLQSRLAEERGTEWVID